MVHQVKRLQSPCCAIVNHDATTLPNIRIGEGIKDFVQYDRVLCDVPCSGDGTLRKNVDIWSRWNANIGPNLHKVQMKILKRGLELLAVGGRLVYSTCSLNPVENEAIIASMMEKCKGCIELIDVSSQLPNLKYNNGLSSWKVFNKKMELMSNLEETRNKGYSHFEGSMFPPDNARDFNLERCARVPRSYRVSNRVISLWCCESSVACHDALSPPDLGDVCVSLLGGRFKQWIVSVWSQKPVRVLFAVLRPISSKVSPRRDRPSENSTERVKTPNALLFPLPDKALTESQPLKA
ncbi:tRNA (cytosine34-C5)-methyltransferase [Mytilus galloprovincialis]|uniref:tRNA (Cytosine34-C5)-methyltransferase n=1 Tax=Mytilus galloprovincialis TaxID=29158 RepID=A0A8B6GSS3_MYTGA|nr:tRNA (cytosine34-C5)-methyltransferase [Mytilus galloprovincialis]